MKSLTDDLQYGVRVLVRNPGFTLAAVLSLGLGIGANTSIFSLVNAMLLRSMPVERPEELVAIYTSDFSGPPYGTSSYPDYLDFAGKTEVFAGLAAFSSIQAAVTIGDRSERATSQFVSGTYFELYGMRPALGRAFGPDDDRTPGAHAIAVLGHGFWQRLGARPDILGQSVVVNGQPLVIVGVAPASFTGQAGGLAADLWMPATMFGQVMPGPQTLTERGSRRWRLMGRLAPGRTREQAQAALTALASQLAEAYPRQWRDVKGDIRRVSVVAERDARVAPGIRRPVVGFMTLLMAVVGLVLLIACANVANLLLARAASRRHEIAVRLSLGAPRARLVRQLLTESLLLAAISGAVGLLIAHWMTASIASIRTSVPVPLPTDVGLDGRVITFAIALSLLTGVAFGLVPALQSTRADLVPALKNEELAIATTRARFTLRHALVVVQVSLSLLLLVAAGLVVRTLQQSQTIDIGFDPVGIVTTTIDLTPQRVTPERGTAFYQEVVGRLSALPGVEHVAFAMSVPLGLGTSRTGLNIEGYDPQPGEDMEQHFNVVSPQYFQMMRIPIVSGRSFTEQDRDGSLPVVMVNEAFARRFWPGQDPVGRRLSAGGPLGMSVVVGVARDGRYVNVFEETRPYVFLPLWQRPRRQAELHVRLRDPQSTAAISAIRSEIRGLDSNLPLFGVSVLADQIGVGLMPQRLAASMLGIFGTLATLLAAVGLYGVLAQSVNQRRREIGVRVALGARPRDILQLIVSQGMQVVGVGLVVGAAAAFLATQLMTALLYGVSPRDPTTFIATTALLAAIAFVACYLPARRAASIDPIRVLRNE